MENRDKCGKMVIFPKLKEGLSQVVPETSEHFILHLFRPNSPQISKSTKIVKKQCFWTNFKQFPHVLPFPSPYFGTKSQILLCPTIQSLSKLH